MASRGARRPSYNAANVQRSNNSELEKFKRRLIRAVARMLLHEKRNEEEVWEGLKKETGCDCKELWSRMHALTIKKLNRLLEAQDRVDMLPAVARMNITDWLLFDSVLVHQDFDCIGMTETTTTDRKVLMDLFVLVEKHKIEFLAGQQLAQAWTEATLQYNQNNRQCSPMLLQRRWYQLKVATRARFYKFWSMYKGIIKRLQAVEVYKPTPLQTEIAKRYKPLVVKPFMMWEDLIKHKLVILPEEFECNGGDKQVNESDNSPDVMCLEPDVETINLDVESDSDLEYRKPSKIVPAVTIKQEPKDVDEMDIEEHVPYENRQEKITNFAEAVMQATAMELNEIDLEEDVTIVQNEQNANHAEIDPNSDVDKLPENSNTTSLEDNTTTTEIEDTKDPVIAFPSKDKASPLVVEDQKTEEPISADKNIETHSIEAEIKIEENNIQAEATPEIVLPQITSIFGGVDESSETLSKIGMLTAQITNKSTVIEKDTKSDDVPIEISSDSIEDIPSDDGKTNEGIPEEDSAQKDTVKLEIDIKTEISKSSWYGELSSDIDFADDGIQLVDDGIEYQDDDSAYKLSEVKTEIKTENEAEDVATKPEEENDDVPKVDKKLLLVPQVLTVKLDDMGILPIELLNHIDNKTIIDIITFKSKPVVKELDEVSESSEEPAPEVAKKVKPSSNLLQKPRSRTYNPIQLCKNPDFNTRLKRLTVGFFSSSRNCYLLKSCKPLTIDVSKAFECRLSQGTMYLEPTDDKEVQNKVDLTESSQNVSVVPSAMAVQSLLDNNKGDVNPPTYHQIPNSVEDNVNSHLCERSKTINLPDISEVRRINQKLLTAQVTPLQLKNSCPQVPVSIVPSSPIVNIKDTLNTCPPGKRIAGPASRTNYTSWNVVDITNDETTIKPPVPPPTKAKDLTKPNEKIIPWKPRPFKPDVPWTSHSPSIYSPDTLLALDTLNKMLYVLSESDASKLPEPTNKKKGPKLSKGDSVYDPPGPDKPSASPAAEDSDDVQVVGETKPETKHNKLKRKPRKTKTTSSNTHYCCWARERMCQMIFGKKRISKHMCPNPLCLCCCLESLKEYNQKQEENRKAICKIIASECKSVQVSSSDLNKDVKGTRKSIDSDVAVIIPIVQNVSEAPSVSTGENKEPGTSASIVPDNASDRCRGDSTVSESTNDVVCNDKAILTEVNTNSTQVGNNEVVDNIVYDFSDDCADMAAEVSIINESSSNEENTEILKEPLIDTNVQTDMRPPPPPKRQRFRVRSSGNQYKSDSPIKVTAGKSWSDVATDTTNLSTLPSLSTLTKDSSGIHVRKDLVSPYCYKPRNQYNPQNAIDPTKPKLTPKTVVNQKMIYLNSKQISDKPSDNPIFLGKNRILLTTAKFPPNFKAFEAFQRNIKQTYALPKGIQLLLQPNGRITYTRDPKAVVSDEYMATLPHLVEALQQQIDASVAPPVSILPAATQKQPEVINLSDDESPEIVNSEKTSIDGSNDIHHKGTDVSGIEMSAPDPEIQVNSSETATVVDDPTAANPNIHTEQTIQTSENVTEAKKSIEIPEDQIQVEQTANIPDVESVTTTEAATDAPASISVDTDDTNANKIDPVPTETIDLSTEADENQSKENNSGKTKNILSDLMAMSGIGPIDVTPTPQDSAPVESSERVSTVLTTLTPDSMPVNTLIETEQQSTSSNIGFKLTMRPLLQRVPNAVAETQPQDVLPQRLTAITSLSELKFACSQNGAFFKLDLDTGMLMPINVCMKKFESQTAVMYGAGAGAPRRYRTLAPLVINSGANKPVTVDLTDDDAPEMSVENQSSLASLLLSDQQEKCTINITTKEGDDSNKDYEVVINGDKQVDPKPLKLFKCGRSNRPNNLTRKLKEIQKRITESMAVQNMIRRQRKRRELEINDPSPNDSDCSSDEEPLSKVAKKMRETEKEVAAKDKSLDGKDDVATGDKTVTVDNLAVDASGKGAASMGNEVISMDVDDEDMAMDDEIGDVIECLEEQPFDDHDGEEDCILGF